MQKKKKKEERKRKKESEYGQMMDGTVKTCLEKH